MAGAGGAVEHVEEIETKRPKKTLHDEVETGIIYLSRVPPFMSVKKVRHIFSQYGEVGRIFLQPEEKKFKGQKGTSFTEGWIEFMKKKVAKTVAKYLNNTKVGGKKRSRWYDELWNIKYLSKFKWGHLNERLAYEKAVHEQRMRTEITQVKKQTSFYVKNVEKKKFIAKLEKKNELSSDFRTWDFKQKETEDDILSKKRKISDSERMDSKITITTGGSSSRKRVKHSKVTNKTQVRKSFLKNLFSAGGIASDNAVNK